MPIERAAFSYLPPSFGRRGPEEAEAHSRYRLKKNVRYAFPRFVIPSPAEGSFSFPVSVFLRNAFCMKHRVPTSQRVRCFPLSVILASFPDRKRKRFLAFARNDDTGMRYSRIVHLAKRGAGNKKGNPISEISFFDSGLFARTHKLEFVVQGNSPGVIRINATGAFSVSCECIFSV